ncbi:MAG: hypothetical protein HY026_02420 [Deltaproteobacteria bacterium]|nr:hypothetical protein [Deltaproteobacteria bacterium]
MSKKTKEKIAIFYSWIIGIGFISLFLYSFFLIKEELHAGNVISLIIGSILIALIKIKKYNFAFKLAGTISFLAGLMTLFAIVAPFEGREMPEGVKLIIMIFVGVILIVMAGICLVDKTSGTVS